MPTILLLTQVLPYPLTGGAKIRAYYMLRHLSQRHDVTLASFVRDDDAPDAVDHLRQYCQAVHTVPIERSGPHDGFAFVESLLSGRPASILRDRLPGMQALLRRLARETPFAVVHADQTAMAQYALYARDAHPLERRPQILLDQHNAMYLLVQRQGGYESGLLRLIWQREARLLRRYETALVQQFDHILTVTEEDRQALLNLFSTSLREQLRQKFTSLPICVDPADKEPVLYEDQGPNILHLGTMFWPPNVEGVLWFAKDVLPLILQEVPHAQFTIAGKNPPSTVSDLAQSGSPLQGHVEVTGYVPDAQPLLSRCRAFVVPVRAGGGMRVKIVDGWQWGLPIVSTTIGAEGIDTRPGENILLADEPQEFANAVVRVLTDSQLNSSLRENGRRWVEEHYDWRHVYKEVDDVYQTLLRSARSAP